MQFLWRQAFRTFCTVVLKHLYPDRQTETRRQKERERERERTQRKGKRVTHVIMFFLSEVIAPIMCEDLLFNLQ